MVYDLEEPFEIEIQVEKVDDIEEDANVINGRGFAIWDGFKEFQDYYYQSMELFKEYVEANEMSLSDFPVDEDLDIVELNKVLEYNFEELKDVYEGEQMKVYEMSFRDMDQKMVEIHGMKMVKLLEKMGLKLDNLYGALMYGYIDHNAGFIFEIVALETKKRNIEYRIVPIGVSCKIPRFDVQEMDIQILDNVNVELFQDKIDMVEKATEVSKELEELRLYKELDPSRHLEYPDDIMVYFLDEGKDVEACWVRLEGIQDGKMYGTVLTALHQNFGVKEKDTIYFGMTEMEDHKLACVWVKEDE